MTPTLIWTIATIWLLDSPNLALTGMFNNQQACMTALKEQRPDWNIEPSAVQCIQVKKHQFQAAKALADIRAKEKETN